MPLRSRVLLGIAAATFTIVVVGIGIAYHLVTKSFPERNGSLHLHGLSQEVKIYRDSYGVPHIIASSDHDAYFAVGFVHAQERLWQMELVRRAGTGRLSEVLGEPALKTDKMFRTLGLWRKTLQIYAAIDDTTKAALEAYAEGVNAYIATHKGSYPIEFDMLNIEPEPWRVEHSILVSRLMAWELNYSRWVDIVLGQLVERFGEVRARELFPAWPNDAPLIVPPQLRGKKVSRLADEFFDAERSYRALVGMADMQTGSNAWVVAGAKTVSGKPLLANDPHLFLTAPARWFDLHVITPTLDVQGVSIVGVPFVIIGRNRSIAWGVTNAMLDDEDFYVERVDSLQHPSKYLMNNEWRPIQERVDTILVKDSAPVLLTTYSTHRGPIVNRMEPSADLARSLLSMRWTGNEISNEAKAFYLVNRARTWDEFKQGLRHFAVPAQNFVYADVEGNIGYYTGGKLPIRSVKGPTLPLPGWTDEFDWKGFVRFEDMPQRLNPVEGFIATANNKIVDDTYRYYISNYWEPPWRAERITAVLNEEEKISADDCKRLQLDLFSPHAKNLVPIILHAYQNIIVDDTNVATALSYMRNWNYEMRTEDVATTLFESTFLHIVHNTFQDEFGPQLLGLYDTLASIPMTVTTRLLQDSASVWFDDITTPQREYRDDIIRLSLREAIQELKETLGGELKEWQWGRVHQVTFGHVFGQNKLLRSIFNVGPFGRGGSHSTVSKGDFRLAAPYVNTVGPSTRQIFDLSDVNGTFAVTPPGETGHAFDKHYQDQMTLWLNGGYRSVVMDIDRIEKSCRDLLILEPQR